jgi:ankyrin repeat protein
VKVKVCFLLLMLQMGIASLRAQEPPHFILPGVPVPPDAAAHEALWRAAYANDVESIARLLKEHPNFVHEEVLSGPNPLHVAAEKGNLEAINFLLNKGFDPNAEGDTFGSGNAHLTALEVAVWYGNSNVFDRLIEAKANPNHIGHLEGSALHLAFSLGGDWNQPHMRRRMAEVLLDHGANPFLEDRSKKTPLELSITFAGGAFAPRMLTDKKAPVFLAQEGKRLLLEAVKRGEVEAVDALLQYGVFAKSENYPDASPMQTLAIAASEASRQEKFDPRRWDKVKMLLQSAGAQYDVFSATGLDDLETARLLQATNAGIILERDRQGDSPLHWAAREDVSKLTRFWLEAGAPVSSTNLAGQTPLHLAASLGWVDQMKLLIAAKAPLDVRDTNGWTPLETAIQARRPLAIRLLMLHDTKGTNNGRGIATALHRAVAAGDTNLLFKALPFAKDLEAKDELGFTALHVAMQRGDLFAATQLLKAGAKVNATDLAGNTALHLVLDGPLWNISTHAPPGTFEKLMQDPRVKRFLPRNNEPPPSCVLEAARFLLMYGADASLTNFAGQTPENLVTGENMFSFRNDRPVLLRLMDKHGGDVNAPDADGNTALHRLVKHGEDEEVQALIDGGADVNARNHRGRTPLHASAEHIGTWKAPMVVLLKAKASVNARDNEGMTPLHVLLESGTSFEKEAAAALLAAGADPTLRDKHGRTPLHLLLLKPGHDGDISQVIPLLLHAHADPDAVDDQGRTPLHYLASVREEDMHFARMACEPLVTSGVKIDLSDRDGNTALHLAAKSGNYTLFNLLAEKGALLDVTNSVGETPRMLAANSTNHFFRAFSHVPPAPKLNP